MNKNTTNRRQDHMRAHINEEIEALLNKDPTISEDQRANISAILKEKPLPPVPLLVKQAEAAKMMGRSKKYILKLQREGFLSPVRLTPSGARLFRRRDILALIEDMEAESERGFKESAPKVLRPKNAPRLVDDG